MIFTQSQFQLHLKTPHDYSHSVCRTISYNLESLLCNHKNNFSTL